MLTNFTQNNAPKYLCEPCDFKCNNKNDYIRHLDTRKHGRLTNTDTNADMNTDTNADINTDKKTQKLFHCSCGKVYKHRQSLFIHKKKCDLNNNVNDETDESDISNKELVKMLIKENIEFKHMVLDIIKNIQLNNTCKDAVN